MAKFFKNTKQHKSSETLDYQKKIARHRRASLYRIVLLLAVFAAIAVMIIVQYRNHIYTAYDTISSVSREGATDATDVKLGECILTYSYDGAHCTDAKGNVTWNQTFEMQDILLAVNEDVAALAEYNGRCIYVFNTQKELAEVSTTLPVRAITVSATGYVTAILTDTDTAWINTYDTNGELVYTGQTHMDNSGYPAAVSLSPSGELLAVSYLYVDTGVLKTNIAFYNFGAVGENYSDHIVSAHSYTDLLVPTVQFMDDATCFAVGDGRLMFYTGSQIPSNPVEYLFSEELQAVYYSEKYVGLVFIANSEEGKYRLDVYNANTNRVGSYYFDIEYTDIVFGTGNFIVYNETECLIETFDGVEKYNGTFSKTVKLLLNASGSYRYTLVTASSIDTIQLK